MPVNVLHCVHSFYLLTYLVESGIKPHGIGIGIGIEIMDYD